MNKKKYLIETRLIFKRNILKYIILALIFIVILTSCGIITNEIAPIQSEQETASRISAIDPKDATCYWNTNWFGCPTALYNEIVSTTTAYTQTSDYVFGVNDCNDMVIELWQILRDKGITSLITVGNLEKTNESFLECNHAWLLVYSGEGSAAAIETVSASVYLWEQVSSNPQLKQFWEGFLYESPTDLFTDFAGRW